MKNRKENLATLTIWSHNVTTSTREPTTEKNCPISWVRADPKTYGLRPRLWPLVYYLISPSVKYLVVLASWQKRSTSTHTLYLRQIWTVFFHLVQFLHFATNLLVYLHNLSPKTNLDILVWWRQGRFCFYILSRKTIWIAHATLLEDNGWNYSL